MRNRVVIVVVALVVLLLALGVASLLFLSRSAPPPLADAPPPMIQEVEHEKSAARAKASLDVEADSNARRDPAPPPPPSPSRMPAPSPFREKHGVKRVSCAWACGQEERCVLRDAASCASSSCEPEGDVRRPTTMDYCFAAADTCLDAVGCSCAESCWKRGECTGDHKGDADCTAACKRLSTQDAGARYRENRCVLERSCSDIASCGGA